MAKVFDEKAFNAETRSEKLHFLLDSAIGQKHEAAEGQITDVEARGYFSAHLQGGNTGVASKDLVIAMAIKFGKLVQARMGHHEDVDQVTERSVDDMAQIMVSNHYSVATASSALAAASRMLKECGWIHGNEVYRSLRGMEASGRFHG